MVARQGFGSPEKYGPRAPTSVKALLPYLRAAQQAGVQHDRRGVRAGMTAMSAPMRTRDGEVLGVVTIAGPLFRLPENRMIELGPRLVATAAEIADTGRASRLFKPKAA